MSFQSSIQDRFQKPVAPTLTITELGSVTSAILRLNICLRTPNGRGKLAVKRRQRLLEIPPPRFIRARPSNLLVILRVTLLKSQAAAHDPPDGNTGESANGTSSSANDGISNGTTDTADGLTKDNTNGISNDPTSDTVYRTSGGAAHPTATNTLLPYTTFYHVQNWDPIAFVYCHPNFDTDTVNFLVADHRGCMVHPSQVRSTYHLTLEQASAVAISRRDSRESKRVGTHNLRLVIYWARRRLVADIKRFLASRDTGTVSYFPPADPEQPAEDLAELVQFRPAMALMLQDCRAPFLGFRTKDQISHGEYLYREAMKRIWVDRIPVEDRYDVVGEVVYHTA